LSNRIPFVIDNNHHMMWYVLKSLLKQCEGKSLDIATSAFDVGPWHLLKDGLSDMSSFRLLLGDEPKDASDMGLFEMRMRLLKEVSESFVPHVDEIGRNLVRSLIAFLSEERVQVRLHTKRSPAINCYLFSNGKMWEQDYKPIAAIIGSSDFTYGGLLSSKELNLACHTNLTAEEITAERLRGCRMPEDEIASVVGLGEGDRVVAAKVPAVLALSDIAEWYEQQWEAARDFKEELIKLLQDVPFIVES